MSPAVSVRSNVSAPQRPERRARSGRPSRTRRLRPPRRSATFADRLPIATTSTTAGSTGWRRSLIACTSSSRRSSRVTIDGGRSATTITGRHRRCAAASTPTSAPGAGRARSTRPPGRVVEANSSSRPPAGTEPAAHSTWCRSAPPDTSAWHAATRRTWRSWRAAMLVERPLLQPVVDRRSSQSRSGQSPGSMKSVGSALPGHRTRHEPHDADRRRHPLDVADVAVVPAEVQVAVGAVEQREVGKRRVRHDESRRSCSIERFTHRSSTVLFHDGSCWRPRTGSARTCRRPRCRTPPRSVRCGVHLHDRRVVAELVDAAPAWATACVLTDRVSPLQREVLEQQHPQFVGGVVRRLRRRCGRGPQRVEPASTASSTSRRASSSVISPSAACRQQVGALDEQALTVDRAGPVVPCHIAQAGSARAAIARLAVDDDHHVDRGQRLLAQRRGHHSCGSPMSSVQLTSLSPAASRRSSSPRRRRRRASAA